MSRSALSFIVLMGIVAMLGDVTYEGARSVSGPFLNGLGASAATVAFVAGFGELVGYGLRYVTGLLADRTGAYWGFTFAGYALNLIAIPGLAFVAGPRAAIVLIVLERFAKAVRSPARSTLISFASKRLGPGQSFGLDEALDQIGAVSGPLLVALAMELHQGSSLERYRAGFLWLGAPVLLTLAMLSIARARFPDPSALEPATHDTHAHEAWGSAFRWYLVAVALLAAATSDWALIAIHLGRSESVAPTGLPMVYALAMGGDALAALAFGRLFDKRGVLALVVASVLCACFAPLVFTSSSRALVFAGVALWCFVLGAQESLLKASVAVLVPKAERARAYGAFYLCFGFAWWAGSAIMGALYEHARALLAGFSSVCALAAACVFALAWRRTRLIPPT